MARMYSRAKGKASSNTIVSKKIPSWQTQKNTDVETAVTKLAKEGKNSSQIGMILRDSHGIADVKVLTKKSITQIMKEKGIEMKLPEDLLALIKRAIQIRKHIESNKQDKTALRGLTITESKINKLVNYYKEKGTLDENWKYDPSQVRIYTG